MLYFRHTVYGFILMEHCQMKGSCILGNKVYFLEICHLTVITLSEKYMFYSPFSVVGYM